MNKKLLPLVLFLTIILSICLSACGDKPASSNPNSGKPTDNNSQNNQSPSVVEVTSVSLSPSQLNLTVGDKRNVTATVEPSNATNKNVTWSSTNSAVAEYINGQILALGEGVCVIKATSTNGVVGSCTVTVEKKYTYLSSVAFQAKEYVFSPGFSFNLNLTIPDEPTDSYKGVVSSSDNSVVFPTYKYDEKAKTITVVVEIKTVGEAIVTVTLDGGATDTVKIISKNVSDDVLKINIPELPQEFSYKHRSISGQMHYYSKVSVSSIKVTKVYVGKESSIRVFFQINTIKTYDEDGSLGTESLNFMFTLSENNVPFAQKNFSKNSLTVGMSASFAYTLDITYSGYTREVTLLLTDYEI